MAKELENLPDQEPERKWGLPEQAAEAPASPEEVAKEDSFNKSQEERAVAFEKGEAILPAKQEIDRLKERPRPDQVEALVRIAFDKGVPEAVRIARELDAYELDRFHDALVEEELRKQLIEKGKLKEV